jgi:hypothetical protein
LLFVLAVFIVMPWRHCGLRVNYSGWSWKKEWSLYVVTIAHKSHDSHICQLHSVSCVPLRWKLLISCLTLCTMDFYIHRNSCYFLEHFCSILVLVKCRQEYQTNPAIGRQGQLWHFWQKKIYICQRAVWTLHGPSDRAALSSAALARLLHSTRRVRSACTKEHRRVFLQLAARNRCWTCVIFRTWRHAPSVNKWVSH